MTEKTPSCIHAYIVASDRGLAPNVSGDVCTLAVCKPVIRRVSEPGENWLVGMWSIQKDKHDVKAANKTRLVYAMAVDEKLTYDEYYNDPRFQHKKPGPYNPAGDNFFYQDLSGTYNMAAGSLHAGRDQAIKRDLDSPVVLVGNEFWYFGENAPQLPEEFHQTRLVEGATRGHRPIRDPELIKSFTDWISATYKPGIYGQPRHKIPGLNV